MIDEAWAGSSPLTRGKHVEEHRDDVGIGLIPAHAGKTRQVSTTEHRSRAHPRSRGENFIPGEIARAEDGSSPLTRGKQEPCGKRRPYVRLIPAHAGKTAPPVSSPTGAGAHPRSRGENARLERGPPCEWGSSPLTRGKPARFFAFHTPHGLIPAHAGKTACERVLGVHGRAHPRSRGENGGVSGDALEVEGSSPLTRGKLSPSFHPPVK